MGKCTLRGKNGRRIKGKEIKKEEVQVEAEGKKEEERVILLCIPYDSRHIFKYQDSESYPTE
jgi:hypothetical protein